MAQLLINIGESHWIGDAFETQTWKRYSLFHVVKNTGGGSVSWPIAEIDVVDHPSRDGCNPHTEVKISIRNDIRLGSHGIDVDKNATELRHAKDVVDKKVIDKAIEALIDLGKVTLPYSVYVCMRHIESFRVEGDFWSDD